MSRVEHASPPQSVARAAERDADGERIAGSVGGRALAHHCAFGRHDIVVVVELPSEAELERPWSRDESGVRSPPGP